MDQSSLLVAIVEDGQFTRGSSRRWPSRHSARRSAARAVSETLFHRDRYGASHRAGDALLPHARAALAAAARGRDTIASLRGMLHGRLRIGVAGPVDHRLAQTLGVFHRAHPEVEIVLTNHHNEPLLAAVAEGDVDVAVVGIGVQPLPPVVDARIVSVEPLVLCVARDHLLGRRKAVRIADLREHPMIALAPGAGLRAMPTGLP
jgi:DNA-binding transcriptional LysR family regulator